MACRRTERDRRRHGIRFVDLERFLSCDVRYSLRSRVREHRPAIFTYAPATNFNGNDSFVVQVSDGSLTDSITVDVTVIEMNATLVVANPIADIVVYENAEDKVIDLSNVFKDEDDDNGLITKTANSSNALLVTATVSGETLTLNYQTNRSGTATITVTATSNGQTIIDVFTVTVKVSSDPYFVSTPIITTAGDVDYFYKAEAADPDGNQTIKISYVGTPPVWLTAHTDDDNLSIVLSGRASKSDEEASAGNPYHIKFAVTDDRNVTVYQEFDIKVSINYPPVFANSPYSTTMSEDSDPVGWTPPSIIATDDKGAPLTWSIATQPENGIAEANGTGSSPENFTYAPNANYYGMDNFVIRVFDGVRHTDANVSVMISPKADPPFFASTAPTYSRAGQEFRYEVTVIDPDGGDTTIRNFGLPKEWLNFYDENASDGIASIVGIPPVQMEGKTYAISLVANDPTGRLVFQSFILKVAPWNRPPVIAEGDKFEVTVSEDVPSSWSAPVLNATDSDGDTMSWSIAEGQEPNHGIATVEGNGSRPTTFNYIADANYSGEDSFVIRVRDGYEDLNATINVTVSPINDAPAFTSAPITVVNDGSTYSYSITTIDSDGDGQTTLTAPVLPSWLTLENHGDGTATLSGSVSGQLGVHEVVLSVSDEIDSSSQIFTVTVNNLPPVITQGTEINAEMDEDGFPSHWIPPTLTATDQIETLLVWSLDANASHGQVVIEGNGSSPLIFTYKPDADFHGIDSFVAKVSDGELSDKVTVTVTVSPSNDPPFLLEDPPLTAREGSNYSFTLRTGGNLTDQPLTLSLTQGPEWLNLENLGDGTGLLQGTVPLGNRGKHHLHITLTDDENATRKLAFMMEVIDGVAPTLSLKGTSHIRHPKGEPFQDPGYVASDDLGEDLTSAVVISAQVDANTSGVYTLIYEVSDRDGNKATPVTREVYIPDPSQTPRALQVVSPKGAVETVAVAVDQNGVRYLAGSFRDTAVFDAIILQAENSDAFLICLEANGSVRWAKSFGGLGPDEATDVAIGLDGSIYLSGAFAGLVQVDGISLISSGGADGFLIKLDPEGSLQWGQTIGGPGEDSGKSVTVASDGSVRWVGNITEQAVLNGSPLASSGNDDVFLAKLSPAGDVDWVQTAGSENIDRAQAVVTDPITGFTYVGGGVSDGVQGNAFLLQYDDNGTLLWEEKHNWSNEQSNTRPRGRRIGSISCRQFRGRDHHRELDHDLRRQFRRLPRKTRPRGETSMDTNDWRR